MIITSTSSTITSPDTYKTLDGLNAHNLYCPRCSCLILKSLTAKLDQVFSLEIPSIRKDETGQIPSFFWVVHDMMSFENIGFTKSVPNQSDIKRFMACAECDLGTSCSLTLGPLGVQTDLFYLAGDRVQYKEK